MLNKFKLAKSAFISTILGSGQFILLTTIAMIIYPGGSKVYPNATRYLFFFNFFSDLGLTETIRGEINISARILFILALFFVGISIFLYFFTALILFTNKKSQWLSRFASILGIWGAVNFIAIGFTPENLYPILHLVFVYIAFSLIILSTFLYAGAIFLQNDYPNIFAWNCLFIIVPLFTILHLYTSVNLFFPFLNFFVQVFAQKLIIYTEIIILFIQGVGAWYVLRQKEKQKVSSLITKEVIIIQK
ncbi:MAG: hypothetical protein GF308_06035 [Candidatus Heimdallarchaeota archaeon]|nr:hypothetical protein [Candidatus Heimdallarchaeota archaeon]